LALLAFNIKKLYVVLDYFLSFLRKCEGKKTHNMFSLRSDPKFRSLRLIYSNFRWEQGVVIEWYDRKFLYPMLMKCHQQFASFSFKVVLLTEDLVRTTIWIYLNRLQVQVSQQQSLSTWSSLIFKWC
jgi:hypothetical protein